MQVNTTGNIGIVCNAVINESKHQVQTLSYRRPAMIRITPCHRLSIERQKLLPYNCTLYTDKEKGGGSL